MTGSLNSTIRRFGKFEVFYMLVMVIYMAQATPETSRMVGGLSGNPIPLLLPMVLTYVLWRRHPISFHNKKLYLVLGIYCVWAVCSLVKYGDFSTQELSYHFFMVYAILIAYIHNQIFGKNLLPIYENILVFLCKIAIVGWLIAVLIPPSAAFFRLFPETHFGNNVLYLFNWMDPVKGQVYSGILRNAGPSWEPGRFAIMVTLAIFCNLCQNGIKFKGNKNIWWLLAALSTTQSTTGFLIAVVVFSIFFIKRFNFKSIAIIVFILVPIIYGLFQLDFIGTKLEDRLSRVQDLSALEESFNWHKNKEDDGVISLDRFESMAFEWMNFMRDPIVGYGLNYEHSFFYKNLSSSFNLTGGLVQIFARYGLFFGLFLYIVLFKSSLCIAKEYPWSRKVGLFILFILSAISYQIFLVPMFTTFWFYGYFGRHLKS